MHVWFLFAALQVRATLHQRWSHVLVDEGQDTNLCQFELVKQLTGLNSSLFMVGDPDQVLDGSHVSSCLCACWERAACQCRRQVATAAKDER